jgi:DNA processing protein
MSFELKYILGFSKLDGVGSLSLYQIYEHFGSMRDAWNASALEWMVLPSLRQSTIEKFKERQKTIELDVLEAELQHKKIQAVTIEDKEYPYLLKEIHNPPLVFFVKGSLDACNLEKTLAIVGSRQCSFSAIENTKKMIAQLGDNEIVIVSGMARGIDTAAHEAALGAGLKTIAVMGSGFDNIYPTSNKTLFSKIINGNGAVISEYYPDKKPDAFRFPQRNRIISGFSKGTLVVEAGLKSGALITARLCLEQNRELMCLPGLIANPNTQGTHKLLKDGAGLVTCSEDILNYLQWTQSDNINKNNEDKKIELNKEESNIYDILNYEAIEIDKIIFLSGLTIGDIMVTLTSLELKGLITQTNGEMYVKI